jgi:uncharacterized Tic20 family protein
MNLNDFMSFSFDVFPSGHVMKHLLVYSYTICCLLHVFFIAGFTSGFIHMLPFWRAFLQVTMRWTIGMMQFMHISAMKGSEGDSPDGFHLRPRWMMEG